MIRQALAGLLLLGGTASLGVAASVTDTTEVTSPDGHLVAWVKATPGCLVSTGLGDVEASELWIRRTSDESSRMLLRGHDADDTRHVIANMDNLRFSLDSRVLYFDSVAWATSGAVHSVNIESGQESFITDGSMIEVIKNGTTAGNLLIDRFLIKADVDGEPVGRSVYRWMYTKDGFAVAELGPGQDL